MKTNLERLIGYILNKLEVSIFICSLNLKIFWNYANKETFSFMTGKIGGLKIQKNYEKRNRLPSTSDFCLLHHVCLIFSLVNFLTLHSVHGFLVLTKPSVFMPFHLKIYTHFIYKQQKTNISQIDVLIPSHLYVRM